MRRWLFSSVVSFYRITTVLSKMPPTVALWKEEGSHIMLRHKPSVGRRTFYFTPGGTGLYRIQQE
jgi:hypothetical protein